MARKFRAVEQAVIFMRCSTSEQARSGLGLEAQEAACRALAAERGLTVVGVFADEGVCRDTDAEESPALMAAIAAMPAGGTLIVKSVDRLAGNPAKSHAVEYMIRRAGGRLASCADEGVGDDSFEGDVKRFVADLYSKMERRKIRERTRAALAAKKARRERLGGDPLGYRTLSDRSVIVDPAGMAAVERARQLRAQGMTLRAVAATLTAEGHRTQQGAAWHATTVARVCRTRYMDTVAA